MRATHDEWIATRAACSSGEVSKLRQLASGDPSWAAGFVYPGLGQLICSQAPSPHLMQMCAQAGNSSSADPDCQLDEQAKQASGEFYTPPDSAPLAVLPRMPLRRLLLVICGGKRHAWLLSAQAAAHQRYPLLVVQLHSCANIVRFRLAGRCPRLRRHRRQAHPAKGSRPLGWLLVLVAGLEVL